VSWARGLAIKATAILDFGLKDSGTRRLTVLLDGYWAMAGEKAKDAGEGVASQRQGRLQEELPDTKREVLSFSF
jgi:hypothetical protein